MTDEDKKPSGFTGGWTDSDSSFFNRLGETLFLALARVLEIFTDIIKKNITTFWEGFILIIRTSLGGWSTALTDWFSKSRDERWNRLIAFLTKSKAMDKETAEDMNRFKSMSEPLEYLTWLFVWLTSIFTFMKDFSYAITGDIRRKLMRDYEPENIDINSAMRAVFTAPEKMEQVEKILQEAGFSDEHIELLFISMYRLYDEGVISQLYLRGELDEAKMFERMRELGYTDTRIKEIITLWEVIPGVQDIVRYIAKEAFEPEKIEMFGLMEEYPKEAEYWAAKQGVGKRWVEAEWVAHWRDLGVDFMLEAFHRKIVDWDLVKNYMSLIEIPPKLQTIVRDTAYKVYSRVDVRRMHDMGVLTDAELLTAYEDQGYDEEKASKMAAFTIRYNAQKQKDLTKSEVLKGYSERIIKADDARIMLIEMKYDENEADYLIAYEDYKLDKKMEDLLLKNIKMRYEENLITEFETRNLLAKINISGERIDLLIEQWRIGKSDDIKLASKADADKFFGNALINEDDYRSRLKQLGYNWTDIELYIKLLKAA